MLVAREPVTLRALAAAPARRRWPSTRTSAACRACGARCARRASCASPRAWPRWRRPTTPSATSAALGAAYAANALENPALYRAMFDAAADLPDPEAAGAGVRAAGRRGAARGRRRPLRRRRPRRPSPRASGPRGTACCCSWSPASCPTSALDAHSPALATAVFTAAGDDPERCAASVRAVAGPSIPWDRRSSGCLFSGATLRKCEAPAARVLTVRCCRPRLHAVDPAALVADTPRAQAAALREGRVTAVDSPRRRSRRRASSTPG